MKPAHDGPASSFASRQELRSETSVDMIGMVAEKEDMVVAKWLCQHIVLETFRLYHYLCAAEIALVLIVDQLDIPHDIMSQV